MRGCNCGTTHQEAHAPGCAGFAVEYYALQADNDSLRAEVERLKKLTDKPAWWTQVQRENDVLRAEVERLTSELASEREVAKKFSLASQAAEIRDLKARMKHAEWLLRENYAREHVATVLDLRKPFKPEDEP